ncbi:MAG: hypothetical protein E4H01_11005 [Lysobacterales bacterium]|nr:MAG: hypothetical protein E4H01_11005 [Xanthomonadales bacterium]
MSKLIDSPFEICTVCDQYVFLDQTHEECAREHQCGQVHCPLKRYFAGGTPLKSTTKDTGSTSGRKR